MAEQKLKYKKTRIAPTPSGFLHLGNVLSFAITAAWAKKSGAKLLLRIDDMDRERADRAYVQDIFDTLNFLEIPWDEGPRDYAEFANEYSQIHRLPLYTEALEQLRLQQSVFACTCSRAQVLSANGVYPGNCRNANLPLDATGTGWRLFTDDRQLAVPTFSGKTVSGMLPGKLKDFIVRRKGGFPAYQLTSVIDDLFWEVDLVIRGEDLWSSTLAQHYLASLLQQATFRNIHFLHHSLLMDEGGQKLSKSSGASSVQFLRKEGRKATEIYGMIARMMQLREPARCWQTLAEAFELADQSLNVQLPTGI